MTILSDLLKSIRPESDFNGSEDFLEDGLLDSFDMVALVDGIEKAYSISIDGIDIVPDNFRNTQTIQNLVIKYKAQL